MGRAHAFAKFFRQDKYEGKSDGGKQKGRDDSDQLRDNCDKDCLPTGICSVCGQLLNKEHHHIISRWISRTLMHFFGIFIPEAQETIDVCPRCHRKIIEKAYRLFSAVLLIRYKKQFAEIVILCRQGKRDFTFEELSILADGGSLINGIANEQPVIQEVEVKT